MEVGHKGPLTKYLETHSTQGWGPAGLLRMVRGSGSAEDKTAKALDPKHVLTTLPGGQILGIELPRAYAGGHGRHGERARGGAERGAEQHRRLAPAAGDDALQSVRPTRPENAVGRLNGQLNSGTLPSAEAQGLTQARNTAETRLRRGIRGYNQAALNLAAAKVAAPHYMVVDEPTLPAPAVSGMKKSVFGVVAGMFVGLLISFLAIVLLTSSEDEDRGDGEREELREVIARADDLDIDAPTGIEWICGAAGAAREGDGQAVTGCPAARHS